MFGKIAYIDRKEMASRIVKVMKKTFSDQRGKDLFGNCEMQELVEMEMAKAANYLIGTNADGFNLRDCGEFIERNARACMEAAYIGKKRFAYEFNALDPQGFMCDLYRFTAFELFDYLYMKSDIVSETICDEYTMGLKEEYILSCEAERLITSEAVEEALKTAERRYIFEDWD